LPARDARGGGLKDRRYAGRRRSHQVHGDDASFAKKQAGGGRRVHSQISDKGCVECHRNHAILKQKSETGQSEELIGGVRNAGIEVSDQELALREARAKLTLARTEVHAFEPSALTEVAAGMKIVAAVDQAGQNGVAKLRYRRRGLALSFSPRGTSV
jgi:hypothetical protein